MTTHEILKAAKARIEDPEDWAQGSKVKLCEGPPICAGIAIDYACLEDWGQHEPAIDALMAAAGCANIVSWNDAPERTHAEVLAAFDRAIAATHPAISATAPAEGL